MMAAWRGMAAWRAMAAWLIAGAGICNAQCDQWSSAFRSDALDGPIRCVTEFDPDGSGPLPAELYACGSFRTAHGDSISAVARWDGARWRPLGAGIDGIVHVLRVWDPDGPGPSGPLLYAGGVFSRAGGRTAACIASWDGHDWRPLGGGLNGLVMALQPFDPDGPGPAPESLVAAGQFTEAETAPVGYIARWDGENWYTMGPGMDAFVESLAVADVDGPGGQPPLLYAGGWFNLAGTAVAHRIAKWDGAFWTPLSAGIVWRSCSVLAAHDPDGAGPAPEKLFAASSDFDEQGGPTAAVISWDGSSFQPVGSGIQGTVLSLYSAPGSGAPPTLYVGGSISSTVNPSVYAVGFLAGNTWQPMGSGVWGSVQSMVMADTDGPGPQARRLVLAGSFSSDFAQPLRHAAVWTGSQYIPIGPTATGGIDGATYALATFDADGPVGQPPRLYIGGTFARAGGLTTSNLVSWNGSAFAPAGSPSGQVSALAVLDIDGTGPLPASLIAAGSFSIMGGNSIRGIARFDGTSWSSIGSTVFTDSTPALAAYDPDGDGPSPTGLYVAGQVAFTTPSSRFQRYQGGVWTSVPGGPTSSVYSLLVWDPDGAGPLGPRLIVGGRFTLPGGITNIASFDGASWSALGLGLNADVKTLALYDEDADGPNPPRLFAGGQFTHSGTTPVPGLARWNGAAWTRVGADLANARVYALCVRDDDGPGPLRPRLYAGGQFYWPSNFIPGISRSFNAARWDGQAWSGLDSGVGGTPYALAAFDPDADGRGFVCVAGPMDSASAPGGTISSRNFAVWGPSSPSAIVTGNPTDQQAIIGGAAAFSAAGFGASPLSFRWLRDGVPIDDGPTGFGGIAYGAGTTTLLIEPVAPGDAREYRFRVSGPCGEATSDPALLLACIADINGSGGTPDDADAALFFTLWNDGDPRADVNGSGGAPDDADVARFFLRWTQGC